MSYHLATLQCFEQAISCDCAKFPFSFELSPKYGLASTTVKLTADEYEEAMTYIEDTFSLSFQSVLLKFKGKISPFRPSLFESSVASDYEWWRSI